MKVQSSTVKEVNYNPKKKILTVDFIQGSTYEYDKVDSGVFKAFKIAVKKKESIGKLFSSMVKGKYICKKIK
jgi:hypothetical protein